MKNQKAINEERFRNVLWRYKDGAFCGSASIQRKPFGEFEVKLFVAANDETSVEIESWEMPILSEKKKAYPSFKEAVASIEKYFRCIDEYAKRIPKTLNIRANQLRQALMRDALRKAMEEKKDEL